MFTQTWNKYLPIIKILLKRSVNGPQTLDMNSTDFQRAAGGRKVKYTFSFILIKGRLQQITSPTPLAKELIVLLQADEMTRKLIRAQDFEMMMNNSFQLTIKNCTPPEAVQPETLATDPAEVNEETK